MLRITQQNSSEGAKRYYATADYYTEGQELVGVFGGRAAAMLGLNGEVDKESFDRLCDNLHPTNKTPLTVRTRSDRTVGYDFTFSSPKSLSLLYALTEDKKILDAFRESVDETMRELEAEAKTRVRKSGKCEDRTTGNLLWAEFIHTTSRPVDGVPDPQLHAHCFTFNTTWDQSERRWKAGQFRDLKRDAPYFQAAFRVRLANKLQDLGLGIDRKRDDFEITGVPKPVIPRFSRRTQAIERAAAERGITDPNRKAELGAITRERKNEQLSWRQLREEWKGRLSPQEQMAIEAVGIRSVIVGRPIEGEGKAVDHALDHCFVRESVVPERKLITEALKHGIGSVSVEGVRREIARRSLIRAEQNGRPMATRPDVLAREAKIIDYARNGRGSFRPPGDPDRVCSRPWFNDGQKAAVRHVLGTRDAVTIVRGASGTGKTTLQQEIGEALAEAGKSVVAVAPTANATEVLATQAGFSQAATMAHFLKAEKMQAAARGGLVLVDEAGMVSMADMEQLVDIARKQNAQIVLFGDTRQHRSVAAGEPMRLLQQRAGLPGCSVNEILRQSGDFKRVARDLSEGRVDYAFAELDRMGWVREIQGDERYQAMAASYLAAIAEKGKRGEPKTALCVTPTHAEAARITETVRGALRKQEKLGAEKTFTRWVPLQLTDPEKRDATNYEAGLMLQFHQNAPKIRNGARVVLGEGEAAPTQYADRFEVFRQATVTFAVGDRVRITHNGDSKNGKRKLKNGDLFTIKRFTRDGDIVTDKDVVISREFGHMAMGYAVTSMASQGQTVHKCFIGLSEESLPATNQRSFYVPVTRAKEQAVIFTDDKKALLKAVQRPDTPMSATELAEAAGRPRKRRFVRHLASLARFAAFVRNHERKREKADTQRIREREASHAR